MTEKDAADGHIFRRFDNEMGRLHALVVGMGELALAQLREAVKTLQGRDPEAARAVIENDRKLNDLDIEADDEIIRIMARRQPMARDLREIIAVGKIVAELERAGDEARKIAGLTIRFYAESSASAGAAPPDAVLRDIYALAEEVDAMLGVVMGAFDEMDLGEAIGVLGEGEKLDEMLQKILRRLGEFVTEDARNIEHFVDIVLGIRALERFGGHARNIAGHLVFIKHGVDVRHEGVEEILRQLKRGGE